MLFKLDDRSSKFRSRQYRRRRKSWSWLLASTFLLAGWMGYRQLKSFSSKPEALFVLGGHEERERFAAKLAQKYPHLPIWVSSGSPQAYAEQIFSEAGINRDRLHLDYQAQDTVTNFTTLVDELKAAGIDSVYLITSDNHMRRALLIGEIVFGSRGIILKPVAVSSQAEPESVNKTLRDGARAILWLTTGRTGSFTARFLLKRDISH